MPLKRRTNGKAMTPRCPTCGGVAVRQFRPFCSKWCADIDLGRWFNESYRIPLVEGDSGEDEEE